MPYLVAATLVVRDRPTAAAVCALLGTGLLVARLVLGDGLHRATGRLTDVLGRGLTLAAATVMWVVIVIPAWLVSHAGRGTRLRRGTEASSWTVHEAGPHHARPFATTRATSSRSPARLVRAVGVVVVLLAIDVGLGVGWKVATRSEVAEPITAPLGLHRDGTFRDPRIDTPALEGAPWAESHFRDMQRLPQSYWPQVLTRPQPYASDTVHVEGWVRRSYAQPDVEGGAPIVWFFGGSTTFGEGQRDEHTIPSEIARLAEADGIPLEVVNHGQRSWTAWQEALLFEQLSADDATRPDVVVFYDGYNEVLQQRQDSTAGWPTHFDVDGVARTLTGADAGAGAGADAGGFGRTSTASQVADWYSERSMVLRSLRALGVGGGAGEDTSVGPETSSATDDVGRRAAAVYRRARTFAGDTAAARGIVPVFYWQPERDQATDHAFAVATDQVGEGTVLLDDALDQAPETFFDEVHTNERGARLVAERMWESLRPQVEGIR